MAGPIEIFFSYAHEDEELMNAVREHLVLFDHQRIIQKWHDRMIPPGTDWQNQIDGRLRSARIILFFVSPSFFASNYIYEVEMTEALARHDSGQARVIPIIVRPCLWTTAPFGRIQALPTDGRPITVWPNRDEACLNVAEGIMQVVTSMQTGTA